MTPSSFDRLGALLGRAFAGVGNVAADPQMLETGLAALGWSPPPDVDLVTVFAVDVSDVADKLAAVINSTPDEQANEALMSARYIALVAAVVALVDKLDALSEHLPQLLAVAGDYASQTQIASQLPIRLLDWVVVAGTQAVNPLAAYLLRLVGVFRLTHYAADDSIYQVDHQRASVDAQQFSRLVSDPAAAFRSIYGWGTSDFDAETLLNNAGRVLQSLGGRAVVADMPDRSLARIGESPNAGDPPIPQLLVEMLHMLGEVPVDVVLSLHQLRATTAGGTDAGLEFAPYLRGATDLQIALADSLTLTIEAELDIEDGVAIALRPTGAQLRSGLLSGTPAAVTGDLAVGIDLTAPADGTSRELVSGPGGLLISFSAATIQVGVDDASGGSPDAYIRAAISGGKLGVGTGSADGFLQHHLPPTFEVAVDLGIRWSQQHGLTFEGSANLDWHLPVHLGAGALEIDDVYVRLGTTGTRVELAATVSGSVTLGPIVASVQDIGVALDLSAARGNLGPLHLDFVFRPPRGIGLAINAPLVSGGGFLDLDPDRGRYVGGVRLAIESLSLAAIGLVSTKTDSGAPMTFADGRPGYSLIVIIAATFPPIQLGMGFALSGIGGLLGYNRRANVDALRSSVRAKGLQALLFPSDPVAHATQLISSLAADFPVARGRFVAGPMARITWGQPVLATIDIAVLIELPEPVVLILAARLRIALPRDDNDAVVRINLDALGVLDFAQGSLSLDATIYDSRIGAFTLSGDMALRLNWKGQRRFLMAVGGWNAAFTAPPDFPTLRRVTLSLSGNANLQLSISAYFAVTSNTVQFGGRADLRISGAGALLTGMLSLDTLIHISPFGLRIDFAASVTVSFEGLTLLAVAVSGTITGPAPWHIQATASFTVLLFSARVSITADFGKGATTPTTVAPVSVIDLIAAEVEKPANWLASSPGATQVRLRAVSLDTLNVGPGRHLSFHQRVAPLGVVMARFGPATIVGPRLVYITAVTVSGVAVTGTPDITDQFAPANFLDLTDAQKLSGASFTTEQAGVTLADPVADLDTIGAAETADLAPTIDFDDPDGERPTITVGLELSPPGRSASRRTVGSTARVGISMISRPSTWMQLAAEASGKRR